MTPSARTKAEQRAARLAADLAAVVGKLYDDAAEADVAAFGRDAHAYARRAVLAPLATSTERVVASLRDAGITR